MVVGAPCLERIKKEKRKSLIGVAPGIIFVDGFLMDF
jgi:hypothetical protein